MVTDKELRESVKWYCGHYGRKPMTRSVFETWLCGYFHSYPKAVRIILERMQEMELVSVKHGMVEIQ